MFYVDRKELFDSCRSAVSAVVEIACVGIKFYLVLAGVCAGMLCWHFMYIGQVPPDCKGFAPLLLLASWVLVLWVGQVNGEGEQKTRR